MQGCVLCAVFCVVHYDYQNIRSQSTECSASTHCLTNMISFLLSELCSAYVVYIVCAVFNVVHYDYQNIRSQSTECSASTHCLTNMISFLLSELCSAYVVYILMHCSMSLLLM